MSSRSCDYLRRATEGREHFAGNVAFEAANDLALAHSLSGAPAHVCEGAAFIAKPYQDDAIESRIGLAVTTAVEAVTVGLA